MQWEILWLFLLTTKVSGKELEIFEKHDIFGFNAFLSSQITADMHPLIRASIIHECMCF